MTLRCLRCASLAGSRPSLVELCRSEERRDAVVRRRAGFPHGMERRSEVPCRLLVGLEGTSRRVVMLNKLSDKNSVAEVLHCALEVFGFPACTGAALRLDARYLRDKDTLAQAGVGVGGAEEVWLVVWKLGGMPTGGKAHLEHRVLSLQRQLKLQQKVKNAAEREARYWNRRLVAAEAAAAAAAEALAAAEAREAAAVAAATEAAMATAAAGFPGLMRVAGGLEGVVAGLRARWTQTIPEMFYCPITMVCVNCSGGGGGCWMWGFF